MTNEEIIELALSGGKFTYGGFNVSYRDSSGNEYEVRGVSHDGMLNQLLGIIKDYATKAAK